MRLDAAAVRALHVEPVEGGREGAGVPAAKTHSLLGLLDKCRTSLGHRLMLQWLRQPLVDINKIGEVAEGVGGSDIDFFLLFLSFLSTFLSFVFIFI